MKITKRQLRRIIKEEKRKLIKEQGMSPADMGIAAAQSDAAAGRSGPKKALSQVKISMNLAGESPWMAINSIVDRTMDQSEPTDWLELANELRGIADDVEDSIPE